MLIGAVDADPKVSWTAVLRRRWTAVLALASIVGFGTLVTVNAGESPFWTAFDDIGEALAAAIATVACLVRMRRERSGNAISADGGLERRSNQTSAQSALERLGAATESAPQRRSWLAWLLLACATGAWALGQTGWCISELGYGITPESPSLLDAAFLTFPILVVCGLLSMVETPAGRLSQLRGVTEGLLIATGCLLISWCAVIATAFAGSDASDLGQIVNLAYPVLDAVALAGALFVAVRAGARAPVGLGLLAVGIACLAVSDSLFWYMTESYPQFPGVSPIDTGWVAGFVVIALAALQGERRHEWGARLRAGRAIPALPAVPALLGIATALVSWLFGRSLGPSAVLMTIEAIVVMLALMLQLIVVYENHALTSDLELRVKERTDQLKHQAFHDPLTGLANRALFTDRVEQALARSARSGDAVAVLLVDLDGFKSVNDSLGHQVGDALLCEVASRLGTALRSEDTVARLGGDEFVVLVDGVAGIDEARALAERLREVLRPRLQLPDCDYAVTASIGVAMGTATDVDVHDLLRDADTAMYAAKTTGKDSVQVFAPSMHELAHERFHLQVDLRQALERSEFILFYQPTFDLSTGHIKGFEALIRWFHPTQGMVPPDRFIPLAEETGLIVPIGRWVLGEAMRQAAAWDASHPAARSLTMAINVSAVQLLAPSLLADVRGALADSGVAPARVVLEITEGSLVDDAHGVIEVLEEIRSLGVRIAIDDFGTGYASLSYLQRLPVDILKVDRSFVMGLADGDKSHELLEAILGVGQALSLATVAEGVEDHGQLETVRSMGCDMAQGYLMSKPIPAEVAEGLLSGDLPLQSVSSATSR
jgi:diguanylate cyclase (GGDEF)-like protein